MQSHTDPQKSSPHLPFPTATVSLWSVSTAYPEKIFAADPPPDRGFGRKFLAQLNPRWPITALGDFPLNRSTTAGPHEFYIAGFPGLSLIHCMPATIEGFSYDASHLSTLDAAWTKSIPGTDTFAFCFDEESTLGGFAHWKAGTLMRSFCATRETIFEDIGLPEPFESPYWAGEKLRRPRTGIELPFEPADLAREAQNSWLGLDMSPDGIDVPVAGFAIDGRPEPAAASRQSTHYGTTSRRSARSAAETRTELSGASIQEDYDDYAPTPDLIVREWTDVSRRDIAGLAQSGAKKTFAVAKKGGGAVAKIPGIIGDRVREFARRNGRGPK